MRGQGIVEYILALILIVVVMIVFLALLGPTLSNMLTPGGNPCWQADSVDCKFAKVDQCMARERLTEDQCVRLVGGK